MGMDYNYDNSFTAHKLLRLMEADGREEIETVADYYARWDDYYRQGTSFSDTSHAELEEVRRLGEQRLRGEHPGRRRRR